MFLCLWFLFLVVLRLFLVTSGISSIGILVRGLCGITVFGLV